MGNGHDSNGEEESADSHSLYRPPRRSRSRYRWNWVHSVGGAGGGGSRSRYVWNACNHL